MTKKKHSASSKRWLQEHVNDHYVQKANKEGWRSRAIYKLEEIQKKDKLIKPGMTLVDLGAAPGGLVTASRTARWRQWSSYRVRYFAHGPNRGRRLFTR